MKKPDHLREGIPALIGVFGLVGALGIAPMHTDHHSVEAVVKSIPHDLDKKVYNWAPIKTDKGTFGVFSKNVFNEIAEGKTQCLSVSHSPWFSPQQYFVDSVKSGGCKPEHK